MYKCQHIRLLYICINSTVELALFLKILFEAYIYIAYVRTLYPTYQSISTVLPQNGTKIRSALPLPPSLSSKAGKWVIRILHGTQHVTH